MEHRPARFLPVLAGAVLVIIGLSLALLFLWRSGDDTVSQAATPKPAEGITAASGPSFSPDPSAPALVLGPDGVLEPVWRVKQRETRKDLLAGEGSGGGVGAAGMISAPATVAGAGAVPGDESTPSPTAPVGETTRVALGGGLTPLAGVWGGTAQELADYLLASNSDPRFTVPPITLADYYLRYAAEVGLRADVLWAQMLHETGFGDYGGSVSPQQNNFAGIGATGGGVAGYSFPTAEDGVKAHVAHMVAYVFVDDPASWTNALVDPRYNAVNPRGVARVLSDLDGRWAVPGIGYGATIDRHITAINQG
jgi:hypothetical protein